MYIKEKVSPEVNKERTFHVLFFGLVLNLFLIFHQISIPFSYKIILIKKSVVAYSHIRIVLSFT